MRKKTKPSSALWAALPAPSGGLLGGGEDEGEWEDESEWEDENEDEAFLGALGGIARSVGGLLGGGDGEGEWEDEQEWEYEDEGEFEDEAEEFFKRIGRAFKKASPFLRVLAKTAGPLIATAVGGPAAATMAQGGSPSSSRVRARTEVESELEEDGDLTGLRVSRPWRSTRGTGRGDRVGE